MLLCVVPGAAAGRTLYAADAPGNRVFGFGVGSDGAISWLPGFPVFTGQGPSALVPSRDARHLYAAFSGGNAIGTYSIGSDGALSADGSPAATGLAPSAAAVAPDGTRLFVANGGSDSISRFAVSPNGALASLGDATPAGDQPAGIAMTPDGTHLYVANAADDTISVYSVGSSGTLTASASAVPAGDGPTGLAITPDGAYLYATNTNAGTVSGWSIETDGSLVSLGSAVPAGEGARGIAISPDGSRALVANSGDSTISRFVVAATGGLVPAGAATAGPTGATSVVIAPNGLNAYVGGSSAVSAFDLSPNGTLLAIGSPATTNAAHGSIAITPNQAPEAKFDAVAAPATRISRFEGGSSLDADGTVTHWSWEFGDGTNAVGQTASHTYQQPGTYTVTLEITDNEGCGTTPSYTGQFASCVGNPFAVVSKAVVVVEAPPEVVPEPPCIHDGDDGFCGTADHKAPRVDVLGFTNGSSIATIDAPTDIVGTITPDPSGIKEIRVRFTKAAGTVVKKKTATKRVCQRVKGKKRCRQKPVYKKTCKKVRGKRRCTRKKVVKIVGSKVPACLTVSPPKTYLVKYLCSKVPWLVIPGDTTFRYSLPVALGVGSYTVDVTATDGAGNVDGIEDARNHMTFKVISTPSNQGGGDTGGGTSTTPTTTTPVDDTGSPFGNG